MLPNYDKALWVFGNLRGKEGIWGYVGGGTTNIPPYLPLTPAIPREPAFLKSKELPL
jgi:hypothetical protein